MALVRLIKRLFGRPDRERATEWLVAGVQRSRIGDPAGALDLYRRAARIDDTYPLVHLNIGLALQDVYNRLRGDLGEEEQVSKLEEIDAALMRALEGDPSLAPAHRSRGYVLRSLGRRTEAIEALERFLALAPEGDPGREQVSRDLELIVKQAQEYEARRSIIALAREPEVSSTELAETRQKLLEVSARSPDDAEVWWALGVVQRRLEDFEGAMESFARCAEIDASLVEPRRELATLAFSAERYEEAEQYARQAYELDPTNAAVVCNLGVCQLHQERLSEAREYIELAHRLDPEDPIVAECLQALARAEHEGAEQP